MKWARWRTLLVLAVLASWAVPAGADSPHSVVLLATENEQDSTALELQARVRGELHAAGLEVLVLPLPTDTDVRVAVETSSPELQPAAVIAVRYLRPLSPEVGGAEVWISDRLSNTTLMQVVRPGSPQVNPAVRLAVQVAEVLKARLALLWVKANPPPPPRALPPPIPPPAQAAPSPGGRLLLGLGLGLIRHSRGDVSSWLPQLQVGYDLPGSSWSIPTVGVTAAWTPEETTLERDAGAAHIRQTLLVAKASLRFLPRAAVQPLISAALGAFRVRVRGETAGAYTAHTTSTWSAATTLGAGLWVQPGTSVAWLFEAQALAAWSTTEVRIEQERVATLGFPAFLFGTSVIGRY
jgi:hypothetical protein